MNSPRRRSARSLPDVESPRDSRLSTAGIALLGLLVGLAVALYYAWIVSPVVYTEANPSRLSPAYKAEYLLLVSQSYAVDEDWERARERLDSLQDANLPQTLNDLLALWIQESRPAADIEHLAQLAQKVGTTGPIIALFAPSPLPTLATPEATATPIVINVTATATQRPSPPSPTATATAVPLPTTVPDYRLLDQERVCDIGQPSPRLEVITLDAAQNPLPGVEVLVQWPDGRDHFFTGFKPEKGAGYGDFAMVEGVVYTVALADNSPQVSDLQVALCPKTDLLGGWRLTFQHLTQVVAPAEETTPQP